MQDHQGNPTNQEIAEALAASWQPGHPPRLDAPRRKQLLQLARQAIQHHIQTGGVPFFASDDPELNRRAGVFTTLRLRDPEHKVKPYDALQLRGCMGHVSADTPVYQLVQRTAISAASRDPRFPPLGIDAINSIIIKLAVLSPLHRVTSLDQLIIGVHGLMLVSEQRQGLLLPEVATRHAWTASQFLRQLYTKAGASPDSWPGRAALYSFTTLEFGEVS